MVGIGGVHHGNPRAQLVEGAVVFVGLHHAVGAVDIQHEVAVVFAAHYSTEESVAAGGRAVEDVCRHRRCGGFAVCAREAQRAAAAGDLAEHPGALAHGEATVAEEAQRHIGLRNGGSEHHKGACGIAEGFGNGIHAVGIGNGGAFVGEACCERRGCAVVAGHWQPFGHIVSGEGGHAYAAYAHEVDSFSFVEFHFAVSCRFRRRFSHRCSPGPCRGCSC